MLAEAIALEDAARQLKRDAEAIAAQEKRHARRTALRASHRAILAHMAGGT